MTVFSFKESAMEMTNAPIDPRMATPMPEAS